MCNPTRVRLASASIDSVRFAARCQSPNHWPLPQAQKCFNACTGALNPKRQMCPLALGGANRVGIE
eukprot:5042796-Prymnesium_polylepis.2